MHTMRDGPAQADVLTADADRVIPEGPNLSVGTHRDDAGVTVTVRGEVDIATAPLLRAVLDAVHTQRPRRVVIDLSRTAFLDSAGLLVLDVTRRRLAARRATLVLRDPNASVRRVIAAARLDQVFTVVAGTAAGGAGHEAPS